MSECCILNERPKYVKFIYKNNLGGEKRNKSEYSKIKC